jgi:tRNA (guanine37-N1)-methyltransferase
MRIDIISLFPEMFEGPFGQSIIKRAREKEILDIQITNFREFAYDKHRQVDDAPFGGGSGMVLKPEPLFRAVKYIKENTEYSSRKVILLCPSGKTFTQKKAKELAGFDQLIFICGHYEGFDGRVADSLADEAISIGDYVLTGGELPAMVITDAVSRMLPGVLGSAESAPTDSFYDGLLEFPQYTRPREYHDMVVPEILLSGNHAKIQAWRRRQALEMTFRQRPDLLSQAALSEEEKNFIKDLQAQAEKNKIDTDI